jgi:hypothetical protein
MKRLIDAIAYLKDIGFLGGQTFVATHMALNKDLGLGRIDSRSKVPGSDIEGGLLQLDGIVRHSNGMKIYL